MPEPTNYVFVSWIYINDLNLSNFRQDKDLDYVKLIKPHTLQLKKEELKMFHQLILLKASVLQYQ